MQESLGHRLRLMRVERGLSLREAARRAGVVKETISDIERGHTHPYDVTLAKLAKAYEVPVEELLEPVPLGEAPREAGPPEKSEEDRRAGYLRAWRGFVYKLVQRWEQDPPKSSGEFAVVLNTLKDLLEEGAFERPRKKITTPKKGKEGGWLNFSFLF